jgi:hypothetical protein
LLLCSRCFAAGADGRTIVEEFHFSEKEVHKLESGEILTRLASGYQQSNRKRAIDGMVLIRKPLGELAAQSKGETTLVPGESILDSHEVFSEGDFAGVRFGPDEAGEARAWLNARYGDDLNLGRADLAIIERVKSGRGGRTDTELASEAVREVLLHRYRQYLRGGLEAIEPYARGADEFVSVGEELRASNATLQPIEKHFPRYYAALVEFPVGAGCCEHRFMWLKTMIRSRPTFTLVHRIVLVADEAVLLTERRFYISHSLNSLQLTLGWLPWRDGDDTTCLGIATSANTGYRTGFVGRVRRAFGGNEGAEMVGGVLSAIRDDLEAAGTYEE